MIPLDSLTDMSVFTQVVAAGSLSAASRELGMSLAVVSKRLARLEERLGARLVNRTTRRLSLTEEGLEFHRRAVQILADVEEAQASIGDRGKKPSGLLRVSAAAAFARRQIAPCLPRFQELYPDIRVQLLVSDTQVDLVQQGIDLAIRQAVLPDSNLMVRVLATNNRVVCASPAYLARHGTPTAPQDLANHNCIVFGDPPISTWRFECDNADPIAVNVSGNLTTNDGEAAHAAALAGAGVVLKSIRDVEDDIATGRLVRLLENCRTPATPIQAVYPAGRHLAARLRVFIDFLADTLKEPGRSVI
ncbi:LysR family transcriptional regulator [Microvirga flavescens]|uniref:LysR family transcriptional regulator n=1 Tax=Microvirga flavescens TaxID=2249811 RepID=UPI0018E08D5C|nr:LysR family transcriptional regulator [Microvirga flavescens]